MLNVYPKINSKFLPQKQTILRQHNNKNTPWPEVLGDSCGHDDLRPTQDFSEHPGCTPDLLRQLLIFGGGVKGRRAFLGRSKGEDRVRSPPRERHFCKASKINPTPYVAVRKQGLSESGSKCFIRMHDAKQGNESLRRFIAGTSGSSFNLK